MGAFDGARTYNWSIANQTLYPLFYYFFKELSVNYKTMSF